MIQSRWNARCVMASTSSTQRVPGDRPENVQTLVLLKTPPPARTAALDFRKSPGEVALIDETARKESLCVRDAGIVSVIPAERTRGPESITTEHAHCSAGASSAAAAVVMDSGLAAP